MIQDSSYPNARELRERRLLRGLMRSERLPTFDVVIRNISCGGMSATCKGLPPLVGETVEIQLPDNRQVSGTARWVSEQVFGIAFDEPINLGALFDTIQRQRELAERNASWEVKSKHRVTDFRPDLARMRRV
ncbi:PilZ domain-containing protein [Novosphingobium sp. PASSN1]|uniref:PilZ domain-containing protein n=1 Tax=Novosphingobium sp. PASSN1 TaxID=2015561 RepID=UPI000BD1854C|nr:PilZ domain-containing protein [Novosphingobium sp. PASSN1]OYU37022.1 MAG: hypothetical protein CFE35_01145 [Novosphingobium sp. PASSN1]